MASTNKNMNTMTGQTKMVFITSDEDLVRSIAYKQPSGTRLIDLDDYERVSLTRDEQAIVDSAVAELSQLNSTSDQVYRQMLHASASQQPETSKKFVDLLCQICGDRAIGFNYDVLSCASCKAFFRRNAYEQLEDLKCLSSNGQCPVAHGISRKCHRCRLRQCFAMGMRKEFIVKKEESRRRNKRTERVKNSEPLPEIDQLLFDLDKDDETLDFQENVEIDEMEKTLFGMLSVQDWLTIETIQSLFVSTMQDDNAPKFTIDASDRDRAVVTCLQSADQTALHFINFFRHMNEFESLDADDRYQLMKYNLLLVFPIYKCFNYKPDNHYLSPEENEETKRFRQFCGLFDEMDEVGDILIVLIASLVKLTGQDPAVLSLLVIILVFSQDLSMNEETRGLRDPLAVNRIQSQYIKVLWSYLVNKMGERQACEYFIQLLTMIFRLQSASKVFRDFARAHLISRDSVDQITPLIQTFLRIS